MQGRSLARIAVVPIVFVLGGPVAAHPRVGAQGGAPSRIESVGWLHGCWQRSSANGGVIDEQWMRPAGGTMLGMSRTVRRIGQTDSTIEYEFLRLFARDGKLVYAAHPSGQTPTEFVEREMADGSVVFANPRHDFPQRIIYRRRGADSVVARIEGTIGGNARGVDFPYRRVPCDPRG